MLLSGAIIKRAQADPESFEGWSRGVEDEGGDEDEGGRLGAGYRDRTPSSLSTAMQDIEKDLQRTFPGHSYVSSAQGVHALRRVLRAYAARNSAVGYCQSMNFVAGVLLAQVHD